MRDIKCSDCEEYRNEWCEKVIDSPHPDIIRTCQYFHEKNRNIVEVVRCKDCKNRYEDKCPMRHIEFLECDEDGEYDGRDIVYDYTEDESFCSWGERRKE